MTTLKKNNSRKYSPIWATGILVALGIGLLICFQCGNLQKQVPADKATEIKITCRNYLLQDMPEASEYGLYSYVLFSRKPTDAKEVQRYLKVHRAFRTLHRLKDFDYALRDSLITTQNMNLTYWPLQIASGDSIYTRDKLEALPDSSEVFVDRYDFARADLIVKRYKNLKSRGPFLVSSFYPLSHLPSSPDTKEMLVIDLTRIADDQFVPVFEYFQRKVLDNPQTWQGKFDFDLIKIHFYSALTMHGKPVLFAAKWVGDFFEVKKAFAGQ
ncbi:MAG: hypothetical protein ONB16_05410 [candidate division KSB1 bacterium]|nr:hypothetical protein [candidate division KSB1 bacterium]MDZ7317641.1 hypothetical protein [candidate division KSB1 bacterium]MDZ7341662.1 hypothetical protein [candidate division KSB1 bacterium]